MLSKIAKINENDSLRVKTKSVFSGANKEMKINPVFLNCVFSCEQDGLHEISNLTCSYEGAFYCFKKKIEDLT